MKERLLTLWRWITLRRHRSELQALGMARRLGPLAMLPISIILGFWWLALNLPAMLVAIPAISLMYSTEQTRRVIGGALYVPLSFYAIWVLCFAAPWLFRWYFVAVGLTFGRPAMADRKEAELIANIHRAENGQ